MFPQDIVFFEVKLDLSRLSLFLLLLILLLLLSYHTATSHQFYYHYDTVIDPIGNPVMLVIILITQLFLT